MRFRVSNGMDSANVTARTEAAAMRQFWRALVARRLPTYNGATTATPIPARNDAFMKMNPTEKKSFLARMAKGRRNADAAGMGAKRAGGMHNYNIRNNVSGQDLGVYRASSPTAAIKAMLRDAGHDARPNRRSSGRKDATSENLRATRVREAGRVAGAMVKRKSAAGAGMASAGALPARKGHPRNKIGKGSHSVRMTRMETAVVDLARANHAIVSKVVAHEQRLNSVEQTLSNWARGRK